MIVVLDASAILAVILVEPGRERVISALPHAAIAAPNLAEVLTILEDRGFAPERMAATVEGLRPLARDFTVAQAETAALLRGRTRHKGLSLGDRCCLALAIALNGAVMTADRAWAGLDVGVPVEVIR
ncbi:MAG: type II toxin-antitoxin system VapC family toxin [Gemmobacter sp.]